MGLDVSLQQMQMTAVFEQSITHNLNKMAKAAGIYDILWWPEEHGYKYARDIIPTLRAGIINMKTRPEFFQKFDSPNGWGTYSNFVTWCEHYLAACVEYPDAMIMVCG